MRFAARRYIGRSFDAVAPVTRAYFAAPIAAPMSAISTAHRYSSTICSASGHRMRDASRRPASSASCADVSSKPPGRTRCIGQSLSSGMKYICAKSVPLRERAPLIWYALPRS